MENPKPKRKVDKELLKSFRDKSCVIKKDCIGEVCAHHIKTKGSGGGDVEDNLLALCVLHHLEIHKIGTKTFFIKYNLKENK